MSRKSFWLSVFLLVVIVGGVTTTLVLLTQHEPAFYSRAAIPPGQQRKDVSAGFEGRSGALVLSIKNGGSDKGDWGGQFSEAEINSYLSEHFLTHGLADKMLPDGISDPRIGIDQDCIRLGFRYGTPPWSTIVSVSFRVWLAKGEPNVIVLELQGLHAGALPISAQSLLENISEALQRHNMQVSWYRHDGNPAAALKFQSDQPRPSAQLLQLELKPGLLTIHGHSHEALQSPLGTNP
ncbi:MAG TPA: hypothetical protein VE988_00810 [Gemmataceae bacterium]|nr:hypothetical protein [Gemmataceae bacterium]